MPLRTRIFIIVSVIILVILGVSVFLLIRSRKKAAPAVSGPSAAAPVVLPVPTTQPAATAGVSPAAPQPPAPSAEKRAAQALAKIFIERYGSYSTQNNFQNIRDVENLATPALWSKLSQQLKAAVSPEFTAVTINVISGKIVLWGDTNATVAFQTSKTVEKGSQISKSYPSVTVKMIKSGNAWLVDSFTWEKQ